MPVMMIEYEDMFKYKDFGIVDAIEDSIETNNTKTGSIHFCASFIYVLYICKEISQSITFTFID